jgi:hypothetical protein
LANLILNGSTSGSVTLSSPAVSGTTTLTLPTTTGTVVVTSGAQTIEFADGSAAAPSITNSGDTNTGMFFPAADTIAFAEGGAESMRIDSSGRVLMGTTTANGTLTVNGGVSAQDFVVGYDITGSKHVASRLIYDRTSSSAANVVVEDSSIGYVVRRSTSSLKYKNNVNNSTHGLDDVMKLRSVTYKGINNGDKIFGGLIAEEVHEAGLTEFVQYDEEGKPDALAYGQMVALAFKAIQEQQTIIETLKSDIAELKAKVNV